MKRTATFVKSPFGVAVLGCLALVCWALASGGAFDSALAAQARTSSIAAAPGVELDEPAAERIIGNRKLVVVFLEPGADLREGCDDVGSAADGMLVLLLSRADDEYDTYGCAQFPGGDDENFGKSFVAEARISSGIDEFADAPLTALKIIAVNYDLLVKAGIVPDGPRTISPPLPRYLIAAAAVAATLAGAALAYLAARRAGRLAAEHRDERQRQADDRATLNAEAATLAQRIIAIDTAGGPHTPTSRRAFRELASDYAKLAADIATTEGPPDPILLTRVREMTARAGELA
ncbi:hypothetical protein [Actinokineospora sp. NPDC004072]